MEPTLANAQFSCLTYKAARLTRNVGHQRMKYIIPYSLALFFILSGCKSFDHQTSEFESHALIKIGTVSDSERTILKFDNGQIHKYHENKTYRITPGLHEIKIHERAIQTKKYTNKPADALARAAMGLSGDPLPPDSYQEIKEKKFIVPYYVKQNRYYILTLYNLEEIKSKQE